LARWRTSILYRSKRTLVFPIRRVKLQFLLKSPPQTRLLHRIYQRSKPLNTYFQTVAALDGANAAGRAGQDGVTW
jgi:hypothetical protein